MAEQLAQQPGPGAEPSLVLDPTQQQLFRSLGKWVGVTHPNQEYVASQIPRPAGHCASVGGASCNSLSVTLEEIP